MNEFYDFSSFDTYKQMKDQLSKESICFVHDDSNLESPVRLIYAQGIEYNINNSNIDIVYDKSTGQLYYTNNGEKYNIVNIDQLINDRIVDIPTASSQKIGGIKLGYSETSTNKAVKLNESGRAYVTIPQTDQTSQYAEFRYSKTSSDKSIPTINKQSRNPGNNWHTDPSSSQLYGNYLWMTTATIINDSLSGEWSKPVCITGIKGEQGQTGEEGQPGISGIPGAEIDIMYCIGTDKQINPNTFDSVKTQRFPWKTYPSDWKHNPSDLNVTPDNPYIWFSQANIVHTTNGDDGVVSGEWSTPKRLSGTNGVNGSNGSAGPIIYPMGIYNQSTVYMRDDKKAPYVLYGEGSNAKYYLLTANRYLGTEHSNGNPATNTDSWEEFTMFDNIFAKIAIVSNGLIGSAVFNGDYMFSQNGVDNTGAPSNDYQNFNPLNPDSGDFVPNFYVNLLTGKIYCKNITIGDDSEIQGHLSIRSGSEDTINLVQHGQFADDEGNYQQVGSIVKGDNGVVLYLISSDGHTGPMMAFRQDSEDVDINSTLDKFQISTGVNKIPLFITKDKMLFRDYSNGNSAVVYITTSSDNTNKGLFVYNNPGQNNRGLYIAGTDESDQEYFYKISVERGQLKAVKTTAVVSPLSEE